MSMPLCQQFFSRMYPQFILPLFKKKKKKERKSYFYKVCIRPYKSRVKTEFIQQNIKCDAALKTAQHTEQQARHTASASFIRTSTGIISFLASTGY
jgi:hypothetical protein